MKPTIRAIPSLVRESYEKNNGLINLLTIVTGLESAYIFLISDKLAQWPALAFLFIPWFSFIPSPARVVFDVALIAAIMLLAVFLRKRIRKYFHRYWNTLRAIGCYSEHVAVAFLVLAPLLQSLLRSDTFQSMFLFNGDFIVLVYLIFVFLALVGKKESKRARRRKRDRVLAGC